jgi:hypothetical protein
MVLVLSCQNKEGRKKGDKEKRERKKEKRERENKKEKKIKNKKRRAEESESEPASSTRIKGHHVYVPSSYGIICQEKIFRCLAPPSLALARAWKALS